MQRFAVKIARCAVALAALGGALVAGAAPSSAAPWDGHRLEFAAPAFEQQWHAADEAVQTGRSARSWTWGPRPWFDEKEFYQELPNGLRQVQYFDKARMEINRPDGGVTNGLLPVEMIAGRIKVGDVLTTPAGAEGADRPADIPVAGDDRSDNSDAPTYATFAPLATTDNNHRDSSRLRLTVTTTLNRAGQLGSDPLLGTAPTTIVRYEAATGHNVPKIFQDFLDSGPIPAMVAFGYPITDPYWTRAMVGAARMNVLVQIFERRVLTYTPANPAQYQVEMGNVGQHYFAWRYSYLGQPWVAAAPNLPIVFASNRDGGPLAVYRMDPDGANVIRIARGERDIVPWTLVRSWAPPTSALGGAVLAQTTNNSQQAQIVQVLYGYPRAPEFQSTFKTSGDDLAAGRVARRQRGGVCLRRRRQSPAVPVAGRRARHDHPADPQHRLRVWPPKLVSRRQRPGLRAQLRRPVPGD